MWRDWGLVAIVVLWSAVEALFRADLAWRPVKLSAVLLVALALLWRRTHPLAAVAVALGVLTVLDLARIAAADEAGMLWSVAAALVLPYALLRWASGARRDGGLLRVDVESSGDFDDVGASVGAALYRIAQEAVTYAVRHARHATRVDVRVADERGQVRLTVRDDGDMSATGNPHPATEWSA